MNEAAENAVLMLLKPYVDNLVENAINVYLATHTLEAESVREEVRQYLTKKARVRCALPPKFAADTDSAQQVKFDIEFME